MTHAFVLDSRLRQDTVFITGLALCDLLLMNDRRWPWLILVPRIAGVEEIHRLPPAAQQQLYAEVSAVAAALQAETACEKINIGALGNRVRQLHIHVIARKSGDGNWPGPVWGFGERQAYDRPAAEALAARFKLLLA